jgi:large repetitive protein
VKTRFLIASVAVLLVAVSPAASAPAIPTHTAPSSGTGVDGLPRFAWNAVSGASRYEFQFSADPGFNSTQASFFTENTRATLDKTFPNGTYWWRVRSVDASGAASNWSSGWSIDKDWGHAPTLTSPANGAAVVYPTTPLTLRWSAVPRAAEYELSIATDPLLGSMISTLYPLETQALEFTPTGLLAPGQTYYWAVRPIDAQGNRGSRSSVWSFTWEWPSETTPSVTDLAPAVEQYDPEFSWTPVLGAARYEVEVNSSALFASGSKVCCTGTSIGTSLSPTEALPDNVYYWRVRAIDGSGNQGVWNAGPQFDQRFDKVPPVTAPSIKNLHMHDYLVDAPAADQDAVAPGFQTNVPLVMWDPVPGASAYEVNVAPFESGSGICDWSASSFDRWESDTATNAWTPLGTGGVSAPFPPPSTEPVAKDSTSLDLNQPYCVRVRARSGHNTSSLEIYGDYTYLEDETGAAFEWIGPPATSPCSPSCFANYLGADDYLFPIRGTTVGRMPVFTWEPLDGKQAYWVIVAKDSNFSTIIDYALTKVPAYAPRERTGVETYADETTAYYWAVLPAGGADGSLAVGDPLKAAASTVEKQSVPPTLLSPSEGEVIATQPRFRWTPAEGARRYRLQVAQDPSFGDPRLDDLVTSSTAYSSNTTYPADTVLYWRVQAEDEKGTGLTWSETGAFQKTLATPVLDAGNPTSGDLIPTIRWAPVMGAVSYDFHFELSDGSSSRDANGVAATAVTLIQMTGKGVFNWKVRANFPTTGSAVVDGPWSPVASFTRTIREPANPVSEAGQNRLVLSWDPKTGAKRYRVQISQREDFAPYIENVTTDNTSFASLLTSSAYDAGGTFYWRVAALDADSNLGDFTTARTFSLPAMAVVLKKFQLSSSGYPIKGRWRTITINVKDTAGVPVSFASVRVSGAGVPRASKYTNSSGVARFSVKATRYPGTVTFRITKSGFQTAYLYKRVRRS